MGKEKFALQQRSRQRLAVLILAQSGRSLYDGTTPPA